MYNIEINVSDKEGLKRKFVIDSLHIQLNPTNEPKYRNYKSPFVMMSGLLKWYDNNDNLIESIGIKRYSFVASDKLADVESGRVEPEMVKDMNPESLTYKQIIPDPDFNPTTEEFVLLASSPVTDGNTLWDEIELRVKNYIQLVDEYDRF